jgi:TolB-like protein/Tfp pilus assembly protein PilF/predicted Ser/Thr protein kinase
MVAVGETISHYRILEKLGGGGMGVVYKAEDTRLGRTVALKVLPPERVADPNRKRRFIQEARAASALNHPNIITIYDIDEVEGVHFIAMEYVDGKTLDRLIAHHGLPVEKTLAYAVEMAAALTKAHSAGIVHRDLKPTNVMVTNEGLVKILDFGLAKLTETAPAGDVETVATAGPRTEEGMILGTVGYMSPEQAEGKPVDARSDIFSFGSVLYEMLAGRRAFQGETNVSTIAAILREEPKPLSQAAENLPREVERVVKRCLRKDREHRFQHMDDVKVALQELKEESDSGELAKAAAVGTGSARPRALGAIHELPLRMRWAFGVAGALVAVAAILFALNIGGLRNRVLPGGGAAPESLPRIQSLAVLPLENLSHDPEQDYFADGMTEELIANLGKVSALRVISRTSAMQYKGAKKPLPEIAKELGVDAIVEGSVLPAGDRVRITAQLIQASTDKHLWAESYDRDLRDVLALQSEVARAITREIKATVTPGERAHLATASVVDPEAYRLYLQGRYHFAQRTLPAFEKSQQLFQEALERDPDYAQAYAGLAESYGIVPFYGGASPKDAFPKAKAAALKAVELDSSLAEGHTALGFVLFYWDWDWAAAERELKRAIEINPNYVIVHHWYAEFLGAMGRHDEAIAEIRRAQELDPLSPLMLAVGGEIYALAGRYDEAIEQCRKALDLDPNYALARDNLATGFLYKGQYEQALEEYEKADRIYGSKDPVIVALVEAQAGKKKKALEILRGMNQGPERARLAPLMASRLYLALGEEQKALDWLEKSYQDHNPYLVFLNVSERYRPLRSDPRFQDLLRRMNFPPSNVPSD